MGSVKRQFFPNSDRPEVLVEVQMPKDQHCRDQRRHEESRGLAEAAAGSGDRLQLYRPGAARFVLSYNPELPDPSFAKIIVLTPNADARDRLKLRLREKIAEVWRLKRCGRRQLVFGPYSRFLVNFRVMGPDTATLRSIANEVRR